MHVPSNYYVWSVLSAFCWTPYINTDDGSDGVERENVWDVDYVYSWCSSPRGTQCVSVHGKRGQWS